MSYDLAVSGLIEMFRSMGNAQLGEIQEKKAEKQRNEDFIRQMSLQWILETKKDTRAAATAQQQHDTQIEVQNLRNSGTIAAERERGKESRKTKGDEIEGRITVAEKTEEARADNKLLWEIDTGEVIKAKDRKKGVKYTTEAPKSWKPSSPLGQTYNDLVEGMGVPEETAQKAAIAIENAKNKKSIPADKLAEIGATLTGAWELSDAKQNGVEYKDFVRETSPVLFNALFGGDTKGGIVSDIVYGERGDTGKGFDLSKDSFFSKHLPQLPSRVGK